jgi:hypothetical protein
VELPDEVDSDFGAVVDGFDSADGFDSVFVSVLAAPSLADAPERESVR